MYTVGTGYFRGSGCLDDKERKQAHRKKKTAQHEELAADYTELAAALGDSGTYTSHTGPKYVLPRAANAILELVPPPTLSEADEASWGAFLNGEEGGN